MDYKQQLLHPKWKIKRHTVLLRDNHTCTICGDTEGNFEVHHKLYRHKRLAWEYENYDLTTLCHECHHHLTVFEGEGGLMENFSLMKIKKDEGHCLLILTNGNLNIHYPKNISRLKFTPVLLKKVVHFLINNWLKDV